MRPVIYRLVPRSDFDGLVCAVLLKEPGMISDIMSVHPKDVQGCGQSMPSRSPDFIERLCA